LHDSIHAATVQQNRAKMEPVAMLLLQHGDGPGGVGENCFTPEFDFGVVWIRGFDAVQAP
jgi:hypothetical protein